YMTIRDVLVTMNPADIAAVFSGCEMEQIPLLFRLLPKEQAAECFVEMEPDQQEGLIKGLSDSELRQVLDELYVDDAVDIVEEMPANVVQRILAQAAPDMRKEINEILQYPENSAGSVMTTEYVSLKPSMTVEDAILRIRRTGVDKETIYTCYVLQDRRLVGTVSVKSLLLAPNDMQTVDSIMETGNNLIVVTTHTDQEEVARMMSKYNLLAIPVVDLDNRMVGIVTFDDAMDVMEDETTEDMEIMAGMMPSDKTYLRSSPFDLFLHRIPWLALLMISATFTGLIITSFEDALAAQVALTAFIPMLMDTGGNSGSQSSVTIIRAISLGELEFGDLAKVIWKEIRTAGIDRISHHVLFRTRSAGESADAIRREYCSLLKNLEDTVHKAESRTLYSVIYSAPSLQEELLRRYDAGGNLSFVTDCPSVRQTLDSFYQTQPERAYFYEDPQVALFRLYDFSAILDRALDRVVHLRCGGSLIIEHTEAFTAIDVNSSRYTGHKLGAEARRLINCEAAAEAARQIRLRRLSGTILIDFINGTLEEEKELAGILREAFRSDPVTTVLVDFTKLHICEVTRRKRYRSLREEAALFRRPEDF
ncbi:MAG: magnesium transporter, partial [Eubacterium sp.]|nr:magnesium transporter [Eubacterium sp.]